MPSYTDLQTYRKCPRLYGFSLLGYKPIETPEPLMTGQLVHTAIAAYFKGVDWTVAIATATNEAIVRLNKLSDANKQAKALKELEASAKRARELAGRYIEHWAKDYKATLVEPELKLGNVVCHPDLIAYYQEQRVIVDYKTSKSPDMRWYDVSGQVDLYAYVSSRLTKDEQKLYYNDPIDLIIYDIISEEGIFRHTRPPRLEAGQHLFRCIDTLHSRTTALLLRSDVSAEDIVFTEALLHYPHFAFDCPQRCQFWIPCWLLETANWAACEDYLKENYLK